MRRSMLSLDIVGDHSNWLKDESDIGSLRLSAEVRRLLTKVISNELTPLQRELITDYYFNGISVTKIAQTRGRNKSSVSRGLKSARERISKSLKYGTFHLWDEN